MTPNRRELLAGTVATTVGVVAGCSGGANQGMTYDGPTTDVPEEAVEYLSNTSNFEGEAADWRDRAEVSVTVGAAANGGNNGFGPAAIVVSGETRVLWEWNGEGAPHNVVAEDGSFNSGPAVIDDSETFEHTFAESGITRYFCSPHLTQGMKGVVVVE